MICADEKTSIQARLRRHPTLPTHPGFAMKVEHEYKRLGAWTYLAALDVHRVRIFGRCEPRNGIVPFDRLVDHVMRRSPYREARRVFWILDNGSAHRGMPCVKRLTDKYPHLVPVHGPIHASWLNQIEIYFSILQRKVLTPTVELDALGAFRMKVGAFRFDCRARPPPYWGRNFNLGRPQEDELSSPGKAAGTDLNEASGRES